MENRRLTIEVRIGYDGDEKPILIQSQPVDSEHNLLGALDGLAENLKEWMVAAGFRWMREGNDPQGEPK